MLSPRLVPLFVAAVALLAAAPASAQTPPPTLTGQVVVADVSNCDSTFNPGTIADPDDPCIDLAPENVDAQCDTQGTSRLSWDVSGQASYPGFPTPYPGTFSERGSATIGPQDDPPIPPGGLFGVLDGTNFVNAGPLETFGATFEIDSPSTGATITGVKDLLPSPVGNYGACVRADNETVPGFPPDAPPGPFPVNAYFKIANADVARYTALIRTADGVYADRGFTQADVREVFAWYLDAGQRKEAADVGFVVQLFQSDLTQTELVAPSDRDQCKDGRWTIYTQPAFKNQGDCVSWVATGGRNEPAG